MKKTGIALFGLLSAPFLLVLIPLSFVVLACYDLGESLIDKAKQLLSEN